MTLGKAFAAYRAELLRANTAARSEGPLPLLPSRSTPPPSNSLTSRND